MNKFIYSTLLNTLLITGLSFSFSATAQGIDKEQADRRMKCLAKIEREKLKVLEEQIVNMKSEVDTLCASDKREDAQELSDKYISQISSAPEIQIIRNCGEISKHIIKKVPLLSRENEKEKHICD